RVFEAYVASWGMRPEVARDAAEGFGALQRAARGGDPFDIVLLDFNMPGENGLELAARITGSPALHGTRVILLTSSIQIGGARPWPCSSPSRSIWCSWMSTCRHWTGMTRPARFAGARRPRPPEGASTCRSWP